jgi:hypothetical protein
MEKLIENCFENTLKSKIILLLDGFDEVSDSVGT